MVVACRMPSVSFGASWNKVKFNMRTKSPDQLAKECVARCGPKPKFRKKTDAVIKEKREQLKRRMNIYGQCVRMCWVRFENADKKAKRAHGCPPRPPWPTPGEFYSWTHEQMEDFRKAVMEHKLCVERSEQEDRRDDVLLEEGTTCYPWPSFGRNFHRAFGMVFRLILDKLGLGQTAPRTRSRGVAQGGGGVLMDKEKPCLLCRPSLGLAEGFLYPPPFCGLFLQTLNLTLSEFSLLVFSRLGIR